jgi:hypothetical protein
VTRLEPGTLSEAPLGHAQQRAAARLLTEEAEILTALGRRHEALGVAQRALQLYRSAGERDGPRGAD